MNYKLYKVTGWLIVSEPASDEFDVIFSIWKSICGKNPAFDLLESISSTQNKMQHVHISPWAKTQIFTYQYHLGGQKLVMFFM